MPVNYKFPTNVELSLVTQNYVINREKFIGQSILPFKETMTTTVQWDERKDERGMTAAHELAHSWSGNLVTNATWNDFWLNEGFTMYFEWRIMEALSGRELAETLATLGLADLERASIKAALQRTNWVVGGNGGAAAQLGLARTTLISRMRKHGISRDTLSPLAA